MKINCYRMPGIYNIKTTSYVDYVVLTAFYSSCYNSRYTNLLALLLQTTNWFRDVTPHEGEETF